MSDYNGRGLYLKQILLNSAHHDLFYTNKGKSSLIRHTTWVDIMCIGTRHRATAVVDRIQKLPEDLCCMKRKEQAILVRELVNEPKCKDSERCVRSSQQKLVWSRNFLTLDFRTTPHRALPRLSMGKGDISIHQVD